MKKSLSLLLLVFVVVFAHAQEIKYLKLKQQAINYKPRTFYISVVKDDRTDTSNIGSMRAGIANKHVAISLQNGVANSLQQFVAKNLTQNKSTTPVELHITAIKISETGGSMKGQSDVAMSVAFYTNGEKLIEYSGSAYVQTGMDASPYIEKLIRQSIESSLKEFDNWWMQHKEEMSRPASVDLNIEIAREPENPDQIIYSTARPLTWDDFIGEPDDLSLGIAATYSGFSVKFSSLKELRKITVNTTIAIVFDKTRSWVKKNGHSAAALKHEQGHFNITAIKAYEFMAALRSYKFSPDNYIKELEQLQKQAEKELDKMQQQYDKETVHGSNVPKQLEWDKRISAALEEKVK